MCCTLSVYMTKLMAFDDGKYDIMRDADSLLFSRLGVITSNVLVEKNSLILRFASSFTRVF